MNNEDFSHDESYFRSTPIYAPGLPEHPKPDPPPIEQGPTGNAILTLLSWFVIIALTLLLVGTNTYMQYFLAPEQSVASGTEMMQLNFQSKIMLGIPNLTRDMGGAQHNVSRNEIESLNAGPPEQRFGYCILLNEIAGPQEALQKIDEIKDSMDLTPGFSATAEQTRMHELLSSLFDNYSMGQWDASKTLTSDEQAFLTKKLGWLGELALLPESGDNQPGRQAVLFRATRTVILLGIFVLLLLLMGLTGLVIAIILLAMTAAGSMKSRFFPAGGRGGIYAETFAVWLLIFFASSIGISILQQVLEFSGVAATFTVLCVFFGSLIALAYPVLRGIPFSQVREDIGWKLRNPAVETAVGGFSYLSIMPLIGMGLVVTGLLLVISSQYLPEPSHPFVSTGEGTHPIQDEIASGNIAIIIGVFITVCIAAPVVEETVFRGILYRHLREIRGIPRAVSVMFSAAVSGLIFAIIHPQGIAFVPVLGALGFGFALFREWRGSLMAPMVMHGIHNGIVTCVLLMML